MNYTPPGYNTTVVANKSLGFNILGGSSPLMIITYYENGKYLLNAINISNDVDSEWVLDFENNKFYSSNGDEYDSLEFADGSSITDFSKISGVTIS